MFGSSKGTLASVVVEYFEADELKYREEEIDGKPIFRIGFSGKNSSYRGIVRVNEELFQVTIYFLLESNVPEEKRHIAAEYLTRANYGLIIGNFEMDFSDGEVRYKTSIDVEGGQFTVPMVKTLFAANLLTLDRYYPGLMKVLWSDMDPEAAITEIEAE